MTDEELKLFTPSERKILAVLADGERHSRYEMHGPLDLVVVEQKDDQCISRHVWSMRAKLNPLGMYVVSEYHLGSYYYRLVKLVKPIMPIS